MTKAQRLLLFCAALLLLPAVLYAGKPTPTPTPTPPPDGSKIFYDRFDIATYFSMNSDGSQKAALPANVYGVPSHTRHGGHFWFLEARAVGGNTIDGLRPRYELFAVRDDDSYTVQLTNDWTLELKVVDQKLPVASWTPGDQQASWVATRVDAAGAPVKGGIWSGPVTVDTNGNVTGPITIPTEPLVPLALLGGTPDIYGWPFSWAPGFNQVVYNDGARHMMVYTINPAGRQQILDHGDHPNWSPAGNRIVFNDARGIVTVNTDGTSPLVIVAGGGKTGGAGAGQCADGLYNPHYSPDGSYVVFFHTVPIKPPSYCLERTEYVDRCRSTGGSVTHLTTNGGPIDGWSN